MTNGEEMTIIVYVVATSDGIMRVCWNRQTGTFEGRVSIDVWVQVPSLAPEKSTCFQQVLFSVIFPKSSDGEVYESEN